MALYQYSTLLTAIQAVSDPRKARQTLLLGYLADRAGAGLASNHQTARASADWVRLNFAIWHTCCRNSTILLAPPRYCARCGSWMWICWSVPAPRL
jgi:hypothetical protein